MDQVKVYRFALTVAMSETEVYDTDSNDSLRPDVKRVGLSKVWWEGPHLILARGINREREPLIKVVGENGIVLMVTLYDAPAFGEGPAPYRTWKLKYERVMDRGFLFLDAVKDEDASEAVCLVNAELVEVNKTGEFTDALRKRHAEKHSRGQVP
jgi:hypothetical protein